MKFIWNAIGVGILTLSAVYAAACCIVGFGVVAATDEEDIPKLAETVKNGYRKFSKN